MIPSAAGAAPGTRSRSIAERPLTSADLEALLLHVDVFSLNACAPASAFAGAIYLEVHYKRSLCGDFSSERFAVSCNSPCPVHMQKVQPQTLREGR